MDGFKAIILVSVIIYLPLVGLVYQLAGFHVMLMIRGITTYEFIVFIQKKQREITAKKAGICEVIIYTFIIVFMHTYKYVTYMNLCMFICMNMHMYIHIFIRNIDIYV
jgi:hypothetical protein